MGYIQESLKPNGAAWTTVDVRSGLEHNIYTFLSTW